jgi:hypothetical protein
LPANPCVVHIELQQPSTGLKRDLVTVIGSPMSSRSKSRIHTIESSISSVRGRRSTDHFRAHLNRPECHTVESVRRSELLRDLLNHGRNYAASRIEEHATELALPLADVLVVAGHSVPGQLLPPDRNRKVLGAFAYRVTYCTHAQLDALRDFLDAMPALGAPPEARPARDPAERDPFPAVLQGIMDNRGLDPQEFPFVGLSRSTIYGMLRGRWHRLRQLHAMAGPLGWPLADLAAVANESLHPIDYHPILCHHVGAVLLAAAPCTTEQLKDAGREADRLNARRNRGAWQPVSYGVEECPDAEAISPERHLEERPPPVGQRRERPLTPEGRRSVRRSASGRVLVRRSAAASRRLHKDL